MLQFNDTNDHDLAKGAGDTFRYLRFDRQNDTKIDYLWLSRDAVIPSVVAVRLGKVLQSKIQKFRLGKTRQDSVK
jgi:hypothetical protein